MTPILIIMRCILFCSLLLLILAKEEISTLYIWFHYIQLFMTQRVNLDQYSPQELYQLRQGFESEVATFGQSMNQLRFALDKYEEGKRSIRAVEECK